MTPSLYLRVFAIYLSFFLTVMLARMVKRSPCLLSTCHPSLHYTVTLQSLLTTFYIMEFLHYPMHNTDLVYTDSPH